MNYQTIEIRKEGAIDWLSLNRPEQLNAINPQMCQELQEYFGSLQFNHQVRVVILRGAGRGLCAGYDLHAAAGVSGGPVVGMRFQRQVCAFEFDLPALNFLLLQHLHGLILRLLRQSRRSSKHPTRPEVHVAQFHAVIGQKKLPDLVRMGHAARFQDG